MNAAPQRGSSFQGPMRLADMVYGPWATSREQHNEIVSLYETHVRGDRIDVAAIEARLGRPLQNEQRRYELVNGVAVLPIEGVMAPKANLFMRISGGASTQMLADEVNAAVADKSVRSILLVIDSPGGSVLGTPELGQAIRDASAIKPVVAICDGMICSAAYWAGSSANSVYITGPTVMVGNVGVVATHVDSSAADAKSGVKKTEITAGKYKRIASGNEPLTAEGRASMQEQVDYLYSLFVDVVADNRGTDADTVLEHMADGRVFIGQQAIDAGLVDGVSTVDALIEKMAANPAQFSTRRKAIVKGAGAAKLGRTTGSAAATVTPTAQPAPPRELTQHEKATQAAAHAKKHGIDFIASYKALGFDRPSEASAADKEARTWQKVKEERVAMANEYAKVHGVRFVTAFKALGFDKIGNLR